MNTCVQLTKQDIIQIIAEHFARQIPGMSPQSIDVEIPENDLIMDTKVKFTAFVMNTSK